MVKRLTYFHYYIFGAQCNQCGKYGHHAKHRCWKCEVPCPLLCGQIHLHTPCPTITNGMQHWRHVDPVKDNDKRFAAIAKKAQQRSPRMLKKGKGEKVKKKKNKYKLLKGQGKMYEFFLCK